MKLLPVLMALTAAGGGGGNLTVEKADVLVGAQDTLNFIEGSNITLTVTNNVGSGQVDVTIAASGTIGAPSDAQYLTLAANATLSAERVLQGATNGGITVTDNTTSADLALSINGLAATTEDAVGGDLIAVADASDTYTVKKLTLTELIAELSLVVQGDLSSYALTSHNHDGVYSPVAHNHDASYHPLTTVGVADNNLVEIDQVAGASNGYYARFTLNGLESRSPAEVLSDISAAAASHTHTLSQITDSGALAALNTVGTTQIDNLAVTYAKIQNVTATSRVLGRITAGAGVIEELTAANLRTIINVEDGADVTDFANVSAALAGATAGISVNSQQITNVLDPTAAQHAATKAYVDANIGGGAVDVSGTPLAGEYARWVDADTLEARTTAQVLADIGAAASGHNHAGVYQPADAALSDLAGITLTQGQIFYVNGTGNIVALAAGTSGQFLKTLGAGNNPAWDTIPGGGDMLASNNLSDLAAAQTAIDNLFATSGRALRSGTTATDTLLLQAYDVDGASYTTFGTLTAGNTPTFDLAAAVTLGGNTILTTASSVNAATLGGVAASGFLQVANNLNDVGNASTARTNLGLGSIATQAASAVAITGGTIDGVTGTFPNTGLKVLDTDASHGLVLKPGSNLTVERTLTITTGDASRTLTFNGDATISGTNTGDQTITLTGDVTGSGTGSFAATIATSAVTLAKMADLAADTIIGRANGAGTGVPTALSATQVRTIINVENGADVTDATNVAAAGALMTGTADQTITGGANVTCLSQGTKTTGTYTLDYGARPLQYYVNGGVHTLAPDASEGSMIFLVTNNGSAGAITTSGWTQVTGDAFDTTNGNDFLCYAVTINNGTSDFSHLHIVAMQ